MNVAVFECLLIGYICGCFLTADVVCRLRLHKSAFDVGSHNPGMANVGSLLGVGGAAVVLAGDIGKSIIACEVSHFLVAPELGTYAVLWAGLGLILGHDFPIWHGFRGGKGVTVTCSAVVLAAPIPGMISLVLGFLVVLASRYLCYGALAIPTIFFIFTLFMHWPVPWVLLAFAYVLLTLVKHGGPAWRALHGREPKTSFGHHKK